MPTPLTITAAVALYLLFVVLLGRFLSLSSSPGSEDQE